MESTSPRFTFFKGPLEVQWRSDSHHGPRRRVSQLGGKLSTKKTAFDRAMCCSSLLKPLRNGLSKWLKMDARRTRELENCATRVTLTRRGWHILSKAFFSKFSLKDQEKLHPTHFISYFLDSCGISTQFFKLDDIFLERQRSCSQATMIHIILNSAGICSEF